MVVIWERDEDTEKSQDIDQACERDRYRNKSYNFPSTGVLEPRR